MNEKRILWADDDPDDHLLVKECIALLNHDICLIEAFDGEEALDLLREAQPGQLPALIVLDINMPRLNGREAAVQIIEDDRLRNIPLVLFSTSRSTCDEMFCVKHGLPLIYKPWNFQDTVKTIKNLIDRAVTREAGQ